MDKTVLLKEFAEKYGTKFSIFIRDCMADHLQKNQDNLGKLPSASIFFSVYGLVWDKILHDKALQDDPDVDILDAEGIQGKYLIYRSRLVVSLSKARDNRSCPATRSSMTACRFNAQMKIDFIDVPNPVNAYMYYIVDDFYQVVETGIQCPKGDGVEVYQPFYGEVLTQNLMFEDTQNNSAINDIAKQKKRFKKKAVE
jgi:hypothetical protein